MASNLWKFMSDVTMFRTYGVQHSGTFIKVSLEGFIVEIRNFADANYIKIRNYSLQCRFGNEIVIKWWDCTFYKGIFAFFIITTYQITMRCTAVKYWVFIPFKLGSESKRKIINSLLDLTKLVKIIRADHTELPGLIHTNVSHKEVVGQVTLITGVVLTNRNFANDMNTEDDVEVPSIMEATMITLHTEVNYWTNMSFIRVELVFPISVKEIALLLTGNYANDQRPTSPWGASMPC